MENFELDKGNAKSFTDKVLYNILGELTEIGSLLRGYHDVGKPEKPNTKPRIRNDGGDVGVQPTSDRGGELRPVGNRKGSGADRKKDTR